MAEPEPTTDPSPEPEADAQGGGWLLGKLLALGAVVAVVAAECTVAFLYFPSAAETQAIARTMQALEAGETAGIAETADAEVPE